MGGSATPIACMTFPQVPLASLRKRKCFVLILDIEFLERIEVRDHIGPFELVPLAL